MDPAHDDRELGERLLHLAREAVRRRDLPRHRREPDDVVLLLPDVLDELVVAEPLVDPVADADVVLEPRRRGERDQAHGMFRSPGAGSGPGFTSRTFKRRVSGGAITSEATPGRFRLQDGVRALSLPQAVDPDRAHTGVCAWRLCRQRLLDDACSRQDVVKRPSLAREQAGQVDRPRARATRPAPASTTSGMSPSLGMRWMPTCATSQGANLIARSEERSSEADPPELAVGHAEPVACLPIVPWRADASLIAK